jgi:hypothetical protein
MEVFTVSTGITNVQNTGILNIGNELKKINDLPKMSSLYFGKYLLIGT